MKLCCCLLWPEEDHGCNLSAAQHSLPYLDFRSICENTCSQRLSIPISFSWLLMKNVAVWSFINPSSLSLFRKCFSGCSFFLQNCRAPIQAGAEQSGCVQTQCVFSPRTTFISSLPGWVCVAGGCDEECLQPRSGMRP